MFRTLEPSGKIPRSLRRTCSQTDRPNRAGCFSNRPEFLSKNLWNPKPRTMHPRSSMRTLLTLSSKFPCHSRQKAEMVRLKHPPGRRCCQNFSRSHLPSRLRKTNHMPPPTIKKKKKNQTRTGQHRSNHYIHDMTEHNPLLHGLLRAAGGLSCRIPRDKISSETPMDQWFGGGWT